MAAKEKKFVYEYLKNGNIRSVKFATSEQAIVRATDDVRFNRAAPWVIEEEDGEFFLGTEELQNEAKKRIDAARAAWRGEE